MAQQIERCPDRTGAVRIRERADLVQEEVRTIRIGGTEGAATRGGMSARDLIPLLTEPDGLEGALAQIAGRRPARQRIVVARVGARVGRDGPDELVVVAPALLAPATSRARLLPGMHERDR